MRDKVSIFREKIKEKKMLDSMLALLQWDLETQAPKGGYELISKMIGDLSLKSYELTTNKEFIELVENLYKEKESLNEIERKEVEILIEDIEKIKVIPSEEYRLYSELTAKAQGVWEHAREKKDFKIFAPVLKEIFEYNKKFIKYRKKDEDIYSQLLCDYEKGMSVEKLDKFFEELKNEIVPLLKEIELQKRDFQGKIKFQGSKEKQKELSKFILKYLGFDFQRGIISESTHPFTLTVNKNDVRLTTKYIEELPFSSLYSSIHEGGHGIYEQGIESVLEETILADGASMGIHESQSRFYENIIGRSEEFWSGIKDKVENYYPNLKDLSVKEIYKGINQVEKSLIRVEADELTYSLHIMVRYEIEKGIMNGKYNVDDLPQIWNEKMTEYLGIEPKNDVEGVLQDVHWSCGLIGYFPSYALGNVYSVQIYEAMKKDINVEGALERGELIKIKEWLGERIHKYGKLKTPKEIIVNICGEDLNSKYYIDYLKSKYREIYN